MRRGRGYLPRNKRDRLGLDVAKAVGRERDRAAKLDVISRSTDGANGVGR